jgi:hypothetical protein
MDRRDEMEIHEGPETERKERTCHHVGVHDFGLYILDEP